MAATQESILTRIVAQRRLDIEEAKKSTPEETLKSQLTEAPPVINFAERLLSSSPMAVIGEIKRASPSRGDIDTSINAPEQGLAYAQGGAAAISVLTEPKWFKGSLEDLSQVRATVARLGSSRPALLRKDFIIDPYQVYEARVAGADTVLLIVAILTDQEITSLMSLSRELGMEPLVEVNNEEEMKRAISLGSKVIGVNNRNLHTFSVDMNTTSKLSSLVPDTIILAALSGISTRQDVEAFAKVNAKAVLVGESLMKSSDKTTFIKQLLGKA